MGEERSSLEMQNHSIPLFFSVKEAIKYDCSAVTLVVLTPQCSTAHTPDLLVS